MRRVFPLLLLLMLALLAACSDQVVQQSPTPNPTPTSPPLKRGISVLLVPTAGSGTPSQAQLETVRATLVQRLAASGLNSARVSLQGSSSQPTFLVEVPHFGGDEHGTLDILLEKGQLEFWDTGLIASQVQTSFDASAYTALNQKGPPFTGKDLDPAQLGTKIDPQTNQTQITFAMKGDAIKRFEVFTSNHIDDYLTVTLDRIVIVSAVIQSAITGPGVLSDTFTQQQASAVVSVLKYPPLPITLHINSETSFVR